MWLKAIKLVWLFLFGIQLNAQTDIDSLQQMLSKHKGLDKQYLTILTKLAKEYADISPDTALLLCDQALKKSELVKSDSLKGQIYIALSTTYSYLATYDKSVNYAFQSIAVAEKYKDTTTLIDAFNNLGIDFMMQEDDEKAIEYFAKVESLSKLHGDSLRWGHALNNLGMMYGFQNLYEKELENYDQAALIFQAINEKEGYANTLLNSGTTYTSIGKYKEANQLYQKALAAFREINMISGVQNTIQSMAENTMLQKQYKKAKKLALEALEIAQKYQFTHDEIYTNELLCKIAYTTGDYKSAFEFQAEANLLKEEVFSAEKSKQITELETKYQTQKKEQELAFTSLKLEQQRQEKYILLGAIVLIFSVGIFIIYSIKQRSKLEKRLFEEEVENLRLKINYLLGDSQSIKLSPEGLNKNLLQPLTDREFEILKLTLSDKTNSEIAEEVFVSVNTVKYHLKNIYEKLGVNNRKEALHLLVDQS